MYGYVRVDVDCYLVWELAHVFSRPAGSQASVWRAGGRRKGINGIDLISLTTHVRTYICAERICGTHATTYGRPADGLAASYVHVRSAGTSLIFFFFSSRRPAAGLSGAQWRGRRQNSVKHRSTRVHAAPFALHSYTISLRSLFFLFFLGKQLASSLICITARARRAVSSLTISKVNNHPSISYICTSTISHR
jgi:hypothetical protein